MNDFRFALRQLLKNPVLSGIAVLSLTLGVTANSTIFSLVNALLLRPPPVEEPEALWQVWRHRPNASSEVKRFGVWSRPEIAHLQSENQWFSSLAAMESEPKSASWNRNGVGESIQTLLVSGNFFEVCGIQPRLGRFFGADEDRTPGTHPVIVASHRFWQNQLGADSQAVGRSLTINGIALTVIGVAPFEFTGVTAGVAPDAWVPFMMGPSVLHAEDWLTRTDAHSVLGLGRLKPGVTTAQASAGLTQLTRQFEASIQGQRLEDGAVLTPSLLVPVPLRGYVRAFIGILMGAVLLVLLIACANAANLQLARSVARRQEIAVRSALGAGRARLIRLLLMESVLLAVLSGGFGLLLSYWLSGLIGKLLPVNVPLRLHVEPDQRVFLFTLGVSLGTGLLFGLAPALRGTRLDLAATLKTESRGSSARRTRFASLLIAGQMALCLMLLLGAALCLRSLFNARAFNPGFESQGRIVAEFDLNDYGYSPAQAQQFYAQLISRVEAEPGFTSSALAQFLPLGTERMNGTFQVEREDASKENSACFFEQFGVGPKYFATMGTTVLRGREFTPADRPGTPRVAVINQAASARYWPGQSPIGRRIYSGGNRPETALEIVGVVQTGRYRTLGEEPRPAFFECLSQKEAVNAVFVAHVRDSTPALGAIRSIARELDSRLAITTATTLEEHLSFALFPVRTSALLLGVLGVVALILAISGLFGVIAHSVSQRTRELGIRIALGARRRDVEKLIVSEGLKLAATGGIIGILGALAVTRLLRNLLFGISPVDPATFLLMPLLLLSVAAFACWLPARRAARTDPMEALRRE